MNSSCQARCGAVRPIQSLLAGGLLLLGLALHAETPTAEATNLWTFTFKSVINYNSSQSTPAIAPDGTLYIGAFDGQLYAVTRDGKAKWRFQAGREIKSSPAIADDGTIYFGSRDRSFYALTPAGRLRWKFAAGAWVDSSPAIATDGTVCFGSWDKNFYALKPDGALKWKLATGGIVDSSPAIAADGTIYFGSHDKKLYALNPDGTVRWTFLTGAEITSSPALGADGDIYFSSTDGKLYRLKADGTERWHYRIGGGSAGSPVLADNGNIFLAAGHTLWGVSPAGTKLWSWESACWMDETPAAIPGAVCYSAPWRHFWVRTLDGSDAWEAQMTDNLTSSPVISGQGVVYCCCLTYLLAIQPPMALTPATTSWPMFRANARHTGRVGKLEPQP
jgi:outer membrane protein assembly factor BamB